MKNGSYDFGYIDRSDNHPTNLLAKIHSILELMSLANENGPIKQGVAHGAIWVISDYLGNLEDLFNS